MADGAGHVPSGPLDPVAAQIAAFFAADSVWGARTARPPAETRAAIRAATPPTAEPAVPTEDFAVPVAGGTILARCYRPVAASRAIIVWAHGGGFVLGSVDESDGFVRALARRTGCAVVSVDYRLAPEHPFPTAVEDMVAATAWACARRAVLAGSEVPVIAGGDSAGANLAIAATRRLHAAGQAAIAANVLAYPCTDTADSGSLDRFDSPFLGGDDVRFFLDLYAPDPARRAHPDLAPLRADDLDRLPPTLIVTAEHDVITEQAEAYGRRLAEARVAVRTIRYPGMIHGFLGMEMFLGGAGGAALGEVAGFVASIAEDHLAI